MISNPSLFYAQPPGENSATSNTIPVFPGSNAAAQGRPLMSSPSNPGGGHGSHHLHPQHHQHPAQHSGSQKGGPYFPDKPVGGLPSASVGVNGLMCNGGSMPPKDDGSSGYGSPDSEIVDAGQAQ